MALGRIGAFATTSLVLLATLASCSSTARVSDVFTALDGAGNRRRTVFFTDSKEIHCIVESGIGREGVTIEAIVRQLQAYDFVGDRFFDTDRVAANTETSPSPGNGLQVTDVILKPSGPDGLEAPDAPFPPGRFQCEAYLDGKLEQIAIFNIDFPDCPTATIRPLSLCYGFYKKNKSCPKYGVTSRDPASCVCSETKGWECDP